MKNQVILFILLIILPTTFAITTPINIHIPPKPPTISVNCEDLRGDNIATNINYNCQLNPSPLGVCQDTDCDLIAYNIITSKIISNQSIHEIIKKNNTFSIIFKEEESVNLDFFILDNSSPTKILENIDSFLVYSDVNLYLKKQLDITIKELETARKQRDKAQKDSTFWTRFSLIIAFIGILISASKLVHTLTSTILDNFIFQPIIKIIKNNIKRIRNFKKDN